MIIFVLDEFIFCFSAILDLEYNSRFMFVVCFKR